MIYEVKHWLEVAKDIRKEITESVPNSIGSDCLTDNQPRFVGNGFVNKTISTKQGIRTIVEPFNFPITATTLAEAFLQFDKAAQDHVKNLEASELRRKLSGGR